MSGSSTTRTRATVNPPIAEELIVSRPPEFPVETKLRIVLSVLSGEMTIAEAARRNKTSEQSLRITLETYVHWWPKRDRRRGVVGSLLRAAQDQT